MVIDSIRINLYLQVGKQDLRIVTTGHDTIRKAMLYVLPISIIYFKIKNGRNETHVEIH